MPDLPFNIRDRFDEARDGLHYRLRGALTLANLWATVKNLLWLAPLTILIWYTAESSRKESRTIAANITVITTDPRRTVITAEPQSIQINARGTRAELERFITAAVPELVLTLSDATQTGLVLGETEPLVQASDPRRESGITIVSVAPKQLRLNVDEVVEREVPVTAPAGANLQSATFDPPTVKVRGPSSVLRAAESTGEVVAVADIESLPILKTPGKKDPIKAAVRVGVPGVTVAPDTVTAVLDVRESDVAYKIDSVPVFASLPPGVINEFRVTVDPQFVYNVTVIGSPERIAALRSQTGTQVIARIDFLPAEVDAIRSGQSGTKQPKFVLPEGLRVDDETMKNTVINWSSQRREN